MNTTTPFSLRLSWAQGLFERGDYLAAATALAELVDEVDVCRARPRSADGNACCTRSRDLRLLLARAYFQSAQPVGPRHAAAGHRASRRPTPMRTCCSADTLQRAGRHAEAARPLALAEVLGDYERPEAYGAAAL